VDNPDLKIDPRAYFARASVAGGAAALALGSEVEQYAGGLLYLPVAFLSLEFAVGLQHDWLFQGDIWRNLLSDDPLPYATFMGSQ
jgi:hypothetical protein